MGQGVQARQLTALISHLNDVLTERLLQIKALEHGVDLTRLCWLSLGSEGRDEQNRPATDQDNALILPDDTPAEARESIRAFAHAVNLALDACGYPLCRGGIMAGEAACCLTLAQWRERFGQWISGLAQDLLNASIYFDFRALAGDASLARALREDVVQAARQTPRFLKQMALNALTRSVPLNWRGAVGTNAQGTVDLKLQGTAIFVDAARIYSLAHGIDRDQHAQAAGGHRAAAEAGRHRIWRLGGWLRVPADAASAHPARRRGAPGGSEPGRRGPPERH